MHRPKTFASALMALTGVTLGSCDRPVTTPPHPVPAALTEQWQRVAIGNSLTCPERLGCLVGLSDVVGPTTVSIKQVSFTKIRGVASCEINTRIPGLEIATIQFDTYAYELQRSGVPTSCPAFSDKGASNAGPTPVQEWNRSDRRDPFESQNGLSFNFLPLGSIDAPEGRNVRCIVLYDASGAYGDMPKLALREAAETCVTLFYFREKI